MRRRSLLRLGGLGLFGFLAGCTALQTSDLPTVSVSEITLRNRLDRKIDVSVLLIDDEEVAYWQTATVPASPNPFATLDDLPETAGEYTLYAQVPSVEEDVPVEANLVEAAGDSSCITVYMEVTTADVDGEEVPSVAYGSIGGCGDEE